MPSVILLVLLACTGVPTGDSGVQGTVSEAQDNGFGPGACGGHAVTKYWDPEVSDWVESQNAVGQSLRTDFACTDGRIVESSTTHFDGVTYAPEIGLSTQTLWTWDGSELQDQTTRSWDGTTHVLTPESTRVDSAHEDGRIATQDTFFWDEEDGWYLGWESFEAWSTRLETVWGADHVTHTVSSYWQGNTWDLEHQTTVAQSQKTDHIVEEGVLAHTTTLFYDGANWYVGYTDPCCVSWRSYPEWDDQGRLTATETRHWDGTSSSWIVGWEFNNLISVRTEYSWD